MDSSLISLNLSLKSKIQDRAQLTLSLLKRIRNLRLLGEGAIILILVSWTGLWVLFSQYSSKQSPAFSFSLILLLALLVKNLFWFHRFGKLVIQSFQNQEGEFEALTDESGSEDTHLILTPREETFSNYLKSGNSGANSESDCPICLGRLKSEQPVSRLYQSGNHFHQECITRWLH